jgi:type IV pilus assembly protein PilW
MNLAKQRFRLRERNASGFTLVELMVAVAIAVFLLAALVTIVQQFRAANLDQTKLMQLQDEERFAFTVLTDAIQAGGYFGDPGTETSYSFQAGDGFAAGAAFLGSHVSGTPDSMAKDSITTRFITSSNYGPILCDGTDTSQGPGATYTIQFAVDATGLVCSVNGGPPFSLIGGVQAMAVYYGVKRHNVGADDNVDTYVTWDKMSGSDYQQVSAVRVVLTFTNPLYPEPSQPATLTSERVIAVMARAGQQS